MLLLRSARIRTFHEKLAGITHMMKVSVLLTFVSSLATVLIMQLSFPTQQHVLVFAEGTTPITSNVREGILCDDALLLIKQEGKSQLSVVEVPLASAIVWDRFHQENWDERASPKFTFELCGDGASKCPTVALAALDAPGKIAWMRALKSVVTALAPADKTIEPGFLHTLIRGNLWSAAYHGDEELVSQLCRHCTSAAPEEGNSGVTTLSPAAAAVPQLDINALDEEGRSALHWAAYLGHVDVARVLLEAGANIEVLDTADFSTPLHVAVTRGHLGVATLLQANGAAMETRNLMEQTPLMAALTGSSPTDTLLPVVAWLMTKGADAQAADGEGWLPIHRAAVLGVPPLIGSLVRGGADPNAWLQLQGLSGKDAVADWFSPLHLAVGGADAVGEPIPASAFNVDVVTALCAYGAHPNARAGSEGNTALHVLLGRFAEARRGGDATKAAEFMSAASRLMAFGARLDVSNGKGVTASQAAEAASCKAALEASMNLYTSKAVPASAVALMSRIAGACRAPSAPTPEVGASSPLLSHTRCWGHLTPSWTGNDASAGCPVCGSNFTLLFRRHHVRASIAINFLHTTHALSCALSLRCCSGAAILLFAQVRHSPERMPRLPHLACV